MKTTTAGLDQKYSSFVQIDGCLLDCSVPLNARSARTPQWLQGGEGRGDTRRNRSGAQDRESNRPNHPH